MASKGPKSKLDTETRNRRHKALEASREPRRPKTHWDHVLEEMIWLSKDFESERKWKLAQAKRVAIRASKCNVDQATKGEKKMKEEEQRLRKVATNISKEMKKFWTKIEKLVLYKHQLELEERKKKALDKQLDFLLGQTERYSTMLAKNLIDMHPSNNLMAKDYRTSRTYYLQAERDIAAKHIPQSLSDCPEIDNNYAVETEDELEDDEHTLEEDEALITEKERREELAALRDEVDLPLEELLKRYTKDKVSREATPDDVEEPLPKDKDQIKDIEIHINGSVSVNQSSSKVNTLLKEQDIGTISEGDKINKLAVNTVHHDKEIQESLSSEVLRWSLSESQSKSVTKKDSLPPISSDEMDDDGDYMLLAEEKDDETTLSEEERLRMQEGTDPLEELKLLQQESEIPVEELLARYEKEVLSDYGSETKSDCDSSSSDDQLGLIEPEGMPSIISCDTMGGHTSENEQKNVEIDNHISKIDISMENRIESDEGTESENIIADAAAAARSAQPTGNTFSTTQVRTKFPFLLKHPLREYQHIGLDWLVTMYEKRLNGILADEMGLGKTIMTIALLAHLACEKGIWGPHLIVVPTSVMLNWETEFLKWCPAFKILTYFGSAKERKQKRQGWLKPNYFHICITTYRLILQDSKVFKRKKWKYLILDEAHLIKNWKSQRWQTLLNFNSKRRILLTGTPLQNDLMELWSLMHFLMPHIFQSHQEFKDWFSNPITGMVEGQEKINKDVVDRLHNVLRPFILRRLKRDVEKQLPKKHEHVVYCRLSKRQRNLYEDFIASSETQATLASSNFFGMIGVIMQLRKVCNHPDLFEGRAIISSFDMPGIDVQLSSSVCSINSAHPFSYVDLKGLNLIFTQCEFNMTSWEVDDLAAISVVSSSSGGDLENFHTVGSSGRACDPKRIHGANIFEDIQKAILEERIRERKERATGIAWWNSLRCQKKPVYGISLRELVTIKHPVLDIHEKKVNPLCYLYYSSKLADAVLLPVERLQTVLELVEHYLFAIPVARAPSPACWCSKANPPVFLNSTYREACTKFFSPLLSPLRPAIVRRQVYFPDKRLIQFDCGKLQELAVLLRRLKSEGHRALIFTQMTKMLDILEAFINLYGYTYMRLDGSTQPEQRQTLMQRFNTNPKYFLFILSTRSGGVGINLVGADTVIFYDSDWNPAMDQQAQDRCHRIGQTQEVHIYRLISESTIEENILKKANQKRVLDDLVIQSGSYNTDFFKRLDPVELFSDYRTLKTENLKNERSVSSEGLNSGRHTFSNDDVEAALKQAEDEADYMALKKVEQEEAVENEEFTEEATGRFEDEELANDDETKVDDFKKEERGFLTSIVPKDNTLESAVNEGKSLELVEKEDDIDMLADVKQIAAVATTAGEACSLFENKLRPIDRYAMRFLFLWDPIIDKSDIEHVTNVEEEEWELDRIQKLKDDLEAEIDENEEPLLYESWDSEFATKAYKQHVEALAQRQLLEDLEYEYERINMEDWSGDTARDGCTDRKPKPKKKSKKTKFKSLKKESLASDVEAMHEESEFSFEANDADTLSPEVVCEESSVQLHLKNKRGLPGPEDQFPRKGLKKPRRASECNLAIDSDHSDKLLSETKDSKSLEGITDAEIKPASRSKTGGKISITVMPVKRVMVVKPEKLRKRGSIWSKDCIPSPDNWSSQEDAILCAVVHEYGTHWSLVSDVLYNMPAGGFYRGRYRHPIHCCERFRELYFRYINCTADGNNTEKTSAYSSGKALLKVTEDHVETLLNVASELPDTELLLQKHFTALLSSVWRVKCRTNRFQSFSTFRDGAQAGRKFYPISGNKARRLMHPAILRQSSQMVAAVLQDVDRTVQGKPSALCSEIQAVPEDEPVKITLEFPKVLVESEMSFPSSVTISIRNLDASRPAAEPLEQSPFLKSSHIKAHYCFRSASESCLEGEFLGWASSALPTCDVAGQRSDLKCQSLLGKHKSSIEPNKTVKSKVPRIVETDDSPSASKHSMPLFAPNFPDSLKPHEASFMLDNTSEDDSHRMHLTDILPPEASNLESFPYEEDPSFIAGLKDWQSFDDVVDVG